MRDIALTGVVGLLLLAVFRHPVIGAYLYAWLSLMNPHKMTYGFAYSLPYAQITALVTTLLLLFTKRRQAVPINGITVPLILMLLWMNLTTLFAMVPQDIVVDRWIFVMKIYVMLFVTWMLVTRAQQLRVLVWVVSLSVAFFGIKGGVWTLMTGGGGRVWGPPAGMLQGNNELAVGLVMVMPLLYFLRQTEVRAWVRHVVTLCMVLVTFSILGSQSRGALLALVAMAFFLGLKGKYPVRSSIGILTLLAMAVAFMPDTWSKRMETMLDYTSEQSALSRVWAWTTLWNAAVDRPFFGVGFQADHPVVFGRYAPLDGPFAIFAGHVYVAHSIYFQMLGEHGFVGLALFVGLGVAVWRTAGRLAREARDDSEFGSWMPLLARMVQVSLIGYAVGGAFLSLAYLDLPYYIFGFLVSCDALLRRRRRRLQAGPATDPSKAPTSAIAAAHAAARELRN